MTSIALKKNTESGVIWVLEDSMDWNQIYGDILGSRFQVRFFTGLGDLSTALETITALENPDLLIADVFLPDGNFVDWMRRNPHRVSEKVQKVMVVSSNDDFELVTHSFDLRIADYLTKPFSRNIFLAKVNSCLTHMDDHRPIAKVLKIDGLVLDSKKLAASRNGERVDLTVKEMQILSILNESGRAKRSEFYLEIWEGVKVSEKTFDVHLSNLRKKLRRIGFSIRFEEPEYYHLIDERADIPLA